MSNDRSTNWTLRRVLETGAQLAAAKDPSGGTPVVITAKPKTERFSLDYATWRARIAAPGSRFEPEQPAESQIVRLVPVRRAADLPEVEKRTA